MSDSKTTKLTIHSDRPTAITSSAHNANVDAIGFNIAFIAVRNPRIAVELMKLYKEARTIQESDPSAPDEDLDLYRHELAEDVLDDTQGENQT